MHAPQPAPLPPFLHASLRACPQRVTCSRLALGALLAIAAALASASPALAATKTVLAAGDTQVDTRAPGRNFGAARTMRTRAGTFSYAKFNVTGVRGTITSAKLRVHARDRTKPMPAAFATRTAWAERRMTWRSRPARTSWHAAGARLIPGTSWVEYDVTRHVRANGTFSFQLAGGAAAFRTRQAAVGKPRLLVTYKPPSVLLRESFSRADGLVTNEFAYYNPSTRGIRVSPRWHMTSGSLFARSGRGWTGRPDATAPNIDSSRSTNSAIYRMESRARTFRNVAVQLDLRVNSMGSTSRTPAVAWDGVHIPLRRQANSAVYYVTVNRRDGVVMIKKKTGSGTYCSLTAERPGMHKIPMRSWQRVRATVKNNGDGSVTIAAYVNGTRHAIVRDAGAKCGKPFTAAGGVGLRMDNVNADFDNYVVRAL